MDTPEKAPVEERMPPHTRPGGAVCNQRLANPVLNTAGETVGWKCIGCDASRAIRASRILRKSSPAP